MAWPTETRPWARSTPPAFIRRHPRGRCSASAVAVPSYLRHGEHLAFLIPAPPASVIELQSGSNLANFAPGNTDHHQREIPSAGWNSSFLIIFAVTVQERQFRSANFHPCRDLPRKASVEPPRPSPNITITAQVQSTKCHCERHGHTSTPASAYRFRNRRLPSEQTRPSLFTPLSPFPALRTRRLPGASPASAPSILIPGLYTAPAATGTATSPQPPLRILPRFASATVTIVTAADPTITSISPPTGALGATFQEVYLSGTNFISTTLCL